MKMVDILYRLAEIESFLAHNNYAMAAVYISHAIETLLEQSGIADDEDNPSRKT